MYEPQRKKAYFLACTPDKNSNQFCDLHVFTQQINPFMPGGLFYLNTLDRSFANRDVWSFFVLSCYVEIPVFYANSVDPDQTPHSAAPDQGLHYLPLSH